MWNYLFIHYCGQMFINFFPPESSNNNIYERFNEVNLQNVLKKEIKISIEFFAIYSDKPGRKT